MPGAQTQGSSPLNPGSQGQNPNAATSGQGLVGEQAPNTPRESPILGVIGGKPVENPRYQQQVAEESARRADQYKQDAEKRKADAEEAKAERTAKAKAAEYEQAGNEEWRSLAPISKKSLLNRMAALEADTKDPAASQEVLATLHEKYFTDKAAEAQAKQNSGLERVKRAEAWRTSDPEGYAQWSAFSKATKKMQTEGTQGLDAVLERFADVTPKGTKAAIDMLLSKIPAEARKKAEVTLREAAIQGRQDAIMQILSAAANAEANRKKKQATEQGNF
jgi:hypothetical protein